MSLSDVFQVIYDGIVYDLLKYLVGPLIVTAAASVILKKVFHKLENKKEAIHFWIASFVAICTLFYFIGANVQKPGLVGSIQSVIGGSADNQQDTVMVITMSILNTGSMQSIAKNFHVEADANGVKYPATFTAMPTTFTFSNQILAGRPNTPDHITYHNEDNLLEKAMLPIQPGGIMPGILFVSFPGVSPSLLHGVVDYTVTWEDIFSKKYAATFKQTGVLATPLGYPGLHTEMVCPVPPANAPLPAQPNMTPVPKGG